RRLRDARSLRRGPCASSVRGPSYWDEARPVASAQLLCDSRRCCDRIFVLPDLDNEPTGTSERGSLCLVPFAVAVKLCHPVRSVRATRCRTMHRAPVPEAAVYEHRDACSREHDVGPNGARSGYGYGMIDPVPQPCRMQLAPKAQFRARVSLAV